VGTGACLGTCCEPPAPLGWGGRSVKTRFLDRVSFLVLRRPVGKWAFWAMNKWSSASRGLHWFFPCPERRSAAFVDHRLGLRGQRNSSGARNDSSSYLMLQYLSHARSRAQRWRLHGELHCWLRGGSLRRGTSGYLVNLSDWSGLVVPGHLSGRSVPVYLSSVLRH
jgi:hypothetical protein